MHKLLLAREKKNMSKLFHVSMRNTKENENTSVLDKVSRGEIRGISSAIFFSSPEERRTVKDGVSLLERRFTLSRIMKKKKKKRKKAWRFPSWRKRMKRKKKGANDNKGTRRSRHDFHSIMLLFCLRRGGRKVNKALDIHPLAHWNRSRILLIKK